MRSKTNQHLWNEEHRFPRMLLPMDKETPSSVLSFFLPWIQKLQGKTGIEMGCGKGRNCIALAKEEKHMTGFDFSEIAIAEAVKRAHAQNLSEHTTFLVHDARVHWPFPDASFDFGIDCFATTDIETEKGRLFALNEFFRILKSGSLLCVATISSGSPYHHQKLASAKSPGGAGFLLEKTYTEEELRAFYKERFTILALERKMKSCSLTLDGAAQHTEDFWLICEKG